MSPSQLLALVANKEGTQIEFKRSQESFSLRDRILREVVLNMIIQREYSSAFPTSFTILRDTIVTENPQKTTQIILEMIQENPEIHIEELAEACGLTRDGINYKIKKLKKEGRLRRVGPDKGGHWEVLTYDNQKK